MTDQTPPSLGPRLLGPWRRTLLTLNELAAHLTVMVGLLVAIKLLQRALFLATSGTDLIFFRGSQFEFNVQWFFDAADLALLVALLVLGVFLTIWTAVMGEQP